MEWIVSTHIVSIFTHPTGFLGYPIHIGVEVYDRPRASPTLLLPSIAHLSYFHPRSGYAISKAPLNISYGFSLGL